jgi:hypothetical protein
MRKPSFYVLLCAGALVIAFVWRGDLRIGSSVREGSAARGGNAAGEPVLARSREPIVVKPERAPRQPEARQMPLGGTVFDTMGYLLVGAEVSAAGQQARTDGDGRFLLAMAARGSVDVRVALAGYRPRWQRWLPDADRPFLCTLEPSAPWDEPVAPPAPIDEVVGEGRVQDERGRPVAGALVQVVETGFSTHTDDIGRYAIPLAGSGTRLVVSHDGDGEGGGLCAASEPITPARAGRLAPLPDLTTRRGGAIRGTVRDAAGKLVAGVPIRFRGQGHDRIVESGPHGAFRLGGLAAGTYDVLAMAFRGAFGVRQRVELNAAVVDCEVRLTEAEPRRVRVVTEAGNPVPGAIVAATWEGLRRGVARADAEGWVEMQPGPCEGTTYEVRTGTDWRALELKQVADNRDQLVVAAP